MQDDNDEIQTGATEFKTVKAGCGIRFDPDTLDEDSGFDFSQAQELADQSEPDPNQEQASND
jgi:hypothetical protein